MLNTHNTHTRIPLSCEAAILDNVLHLPQSPCDLAPHHTLDILTFVPWASSFP